MPRHPTPIPQTPALPDEAALQAKEQQLRERCKLAGVQLPIHPEIAHWLSADEADHWQAQWDVMRTALVTDPVPALANRPSVAGHQKSQRSRAMAVYFVKRAMVDLADVDSSSLAKTTTQQLIAEIWRRGYCAMPSALAEDLLLAAGQGEGCQSDCLTGALA